MEVKVSLLSGVKVSLVIGMEVDRVSGVAAGRVAVGLELSGAVEVEPVCGQLPCQSPG